jgi:hypothetical protein
MAGLRERPDNSASLDIVQRAARDGRDARTWLRVARRKSYEVELRCSEHCAIAKYRDGLRGAGSAAVGIEK